MSEDRAEYLTNKETQKAVNQILKEDRKVISYRPSWRDVTGSVNATILLQQVKFRWETNDNKPFYKFFAPCDHRAYKPGDSWEEELGFTTGELRGALKLVGKRLVKVDMDNLKEALKDCFFGYFRDQQHLTWHYFNEGHFLETMTKHYSQFPPVNFTSGKLTGGEMQNLQVASRKINISILTENTTENETEDKELILFQHFLEISKKRGPQNDKQRDEWFADCGDILRLAGDDVEYAKELMTQARLDCIKAGYSYAKPGGLINWITGILEKKEIAAKKEAKTWHDGYEFAEVDISVIPAPPDDLELQQIRAIAGTAFQFLDQAIQRQRDNGRLVLEFPAHTLEMANYRKPQLMNYLTGWMVEENIKEIIFDECK